LAGYIVRRALGLVPVLFFISLVTFALMHSVEGGPWDTGERRLAEATVRNLDRQYGLDAPLWEQYGRFVWNALRGDLGISFQRQNRPVSEIILSGFKVTAVLGLLAASLALAAGVSLGAVAALHRNRAADQVSLALATVGSSVPGFVLAIFLVYVLSVKAQLLPTSGWDLDHGLVPGVLPDIRQAVLPVLVLAALPAAVLARITRAGLIEVLEQDYVRTARAKGLASNAVLFRHALRNALIPIITVLGPVTASLVTGSFIIEEVFSLPGTGRLYVQAVTARDYGMIMGATLFYAAVISVANLAVDVGYAMTDPQIRYR
jgi:oligopeptide transport system permease protein